MLSFINTGSDLIYAGSILYKLSNKKEPLIWAKRLVKRYAEVRNENTGLGGYQFNHREPCRVRMSFKEPLNKCEDINETTVITNGVIQTRYGRAALTLLNLFEELDSKDGKYFLDFVAQDLTAIGNHSYNQGEQCFYPLLVDGMKLYPDDCIEGAGYCSPRGLEKVPANGLMFYAYAKAYKLTQNEFFWEMVKSLAIGMGWGELPDSISTLSIEQEKCDSFALSGVLELYKATKQEDYLALASKLGDVLLENYFTDGFFTTSMEKGFTRIDSHLPLALLHLSAAIEGQDSNLPKLYPGSGGFDPKVIIARRK